MTWQLFSTTAFWVAVASIPLVFVGLTFLHAARIPQWVWVLSGRTQIIWLATLAVGSAVIPIGVPAAIWYLMFVRPTLSAIERGDMSKLTES